MHVVATVQSSPPRSTRAMGLVVAACVLASGGPALASDAEVLARADSFLHSQRLDRARQGLAPDEKLALGRALGVPGRQLTEDAVAGLLRNPTAWSRSRSEGRGLLRTIVKSLPEVAGLPGINHTLKLASNVEPSNYRGYGVESIANFAENVETLLGDGSIEQLQGHCADAREGLEVTRIAEGIHRSLEAGGIVEL